MTDHAIIAGSFADFKIIKTRSTAQIIIEIPIERADEALERLGGVPQSGKEKPVAVARLNLDVAREPIPQASEKPAGGENGGGHGKRRWEDLSHSQRAGIRCGEEAFATFLRECHPKWLQYTEGVVDLAATVRWICDVDSRRSLDTDAHARETFARVDREYQDWLRNA